MMAFCDALAAATWLAGLPLLAADVPVVDGAFVYGIARRILHIMPAIMLGGAFFYMKSVLAPAGAEACFAGRRAVLARWVHLAAGLLLVTGLLNYMALMSAAKAAGDKLPSAYHMLFGIKFLLGLLVIFIAEMLAGKTAAAERFRANLERWLSVGWLAIMAIVVLGAVMRTLHA
jgi:hypothetical protein